MTVDTLLSNSLNTLRKTLDDNYLRALEGDVQAALKELKEYQNAPACCRMACDIAVKRMLGFIAPEALGMKEVGTKGNYICPICKRVVFQSFHVKA